LPPEEIEYEGQSIPVVGTLSADMTLGDWQRIHQVVKDYYDRNALADDVNAIIAGLGD